MIGPPGSGKTMLAKRVPTVLPQLCAPESIETTRIYSALDQLPSGQPLLGTRPFRAPHHTISDAGLVGGGNPPAPGEISKAHNGIFVSRRAPRVQSQNPRSHETTARRWHRHHLARTTIDHVSRAISCSWPRRIRVLVATAVIHAATAIARLRKSKSTCPKSQVH